MFLIVHSKKAMTTKMECINRVVAIGGTVETVCYNTVRLKGKSDIIHKQKRASGYQHDI